MAPPGMQPHKGPGSKGWNKEFSLSLLKKKQLPASFLPLLQSPSEMKQAGPKLKSFPQSGEIHPEKFRPRYLTVSCLLYNVSDE